MESNERKEREEGISFVVKKPLRCLVGKKPSLDGEYGDHILHDKYVPPVGLLGDEFGFETIDYEKPKKSSPRKKETKESSPTSVHRPFETISSSFHCLVGMKPSLNGDHGDGGSYDQYISPTGSYGDEYDFKTIVNEKPKSPLRKESKEKQAVEVKKSAPTRVTHPFEYLPNLSMFRNRSFSRNRSFEENPPFSDAIPEVAPKRNHSFVDAIPTPTKAEPLDSASIRDVQKALREME